ncbi:Lysophospholipase, alpha-beta hydrolase superfamily [Prauserella marina]|uniref:Lysophospholipase, alpha-beta hydrolase superfamily n=1 Tax=Prauserella marina TaxID=530584 RepID=A0A1G6JS25_9PSEU|nr:lipase family protein [Prauserella marina]PWV84476.1 alpha-beta hydrolase superfamily lysophospholipase [Prauserella marina]SDC21550.1 Lysophospholipase, alpha-beta hydrolase superfamily [Prauserella marina]
MRTGRRAWFAAIAVAAFTMAGACDGSDGEGQDAVGEAEAAEAANALPRGDFYAAEPTPDQPGTVVRSESFADWSLEDGMRGTRMIYDSRSARGEPVVTSAAVVTPDGEPPRGGWPVIAWAHGTSGVAPQCAPTLMKDLYYGEVIKEYVKRGYAVVATDYSGLGAGKGHEYITMQANANDVRYSVAAARQAVDGLAERWIAVGHSQGGQAAWGAARQQAAEPVGELLGAVALAPATSLDRSGAAIRNAAGSAAYLPYIGYTLAEQYPGFKPEDILTEAGMRHYDRYVKEGCLPLAVALTGDATPAQFLKPGWLGNPSVREFIERNRYANEKTAVPLFVASGAKDVSVAPATVAETVAEQCAHETAVEYTEYPGTHDELIGESSADVMRWIADRFAGVRPPPGNCG